MPAEAARIEMRPSIVRKTILSTIQDSQKGVTVSPAAQPSQRLGLKFLQYVATIVRFPMSADRQRRLSDFVTIFILTWCTFGGLVFPLHPLIIFEHEHTGTQASDCQEQLCRQGLLAGTCSDRCPQAKAVSQGGYESSPKVIESRKESGEAHPQGRESGSQAGPTWLGLLRLHWTARPRADYNPQVAGRSQ